MRSERTSRAFELHFSELAGVLGQGAEEEKSNDRFPLIFIVDELDRCKPPFALELLERIKHVFSVPNVHFVLVSHLGQVESSIRSAYGQEIDARTYLQKFYNLIVHLPGDGRYESERSMLKFLQYLDRHLQFDKNAIGFIEKIARTYDLSFRAVERIAVYLSLSLAFTTSKKLRWYRPSPILAGLCVLKVIDPNLFQKAKSGVLTLDEATIAFKFAQWPPDDSVTEWAKGWWEFALRDNVDVSADEWRGYRNSLWDFSIERVDIVRVVANTVVDRMTVPQE